MSLPRPCSFNTSPTGFELQDGTVLLPALNGSTSISIPLLNIVDSPVAISLTSGVSLPGIGGLAPVPKIRLAVSG